LNDLMAGQIPLMFAASANAIPLAKSGRLIALAVTAPERLPQLPEVPTLDESGLKGFDATVWFGLYAPARTPHAIVAQLSEAVRGTLHAPGMSERMAGVALSPIGSTPEEFGEFLRTEVAKYARVVKAAGIEPQ